MSGTDSSPETADEATTPPSLPLQQTPGMLPTRGIDPPTSGNGPPPLPDYGVDLTRQTDPVVVDYSSGRIPGQSGMPPQRASRPWAIALIIVAIVGVLVLVIGLVVVGINSVLSLPSNPGEAVPSSEIDDYGQGDPGQDPLGPGTDPGAVESSLDAMMDQYRSARDNGSLWNTIPDSDFNRTALSAFLYLLTDMKVAAMWGADTTDYLQQADELERKLLNQEPLGSDVTIKLRDRTFTYDGDTGEGGYTAN